MNVAEHLPRRQAGRIYWNVICHYWQGKEVGKVKFFSRFLGGKERQSEQLPSERVVTLHNTGKEVPLALNVDLFCEMVLREKECAVLLPLQKYKEATLKMMQSFGKQKNPYSFPLICTNCTTRLDQSPSFMAGVTGFLDAPHILGHVVVGGPDRSEAGRAGTCPECKGDKALMIYNC